MNQAISFRKYVYLVAYHSIDNIESQILGIFFWSLVSTDFVDCLPEVSQALPP